ncbi:putative manganese-dependent inorganic diphosphatase [Entomospira culicis]|uniref:inorganic diphosphatase n=1 Tax=Entomospira culicis TaxID=2719989 RepID=A0A968KU13_9SPIO|nr:putative manganese-dependent inorganic diphosphatase [Entomospira culicis]NIZ18819.1 putative manganese-dependent inorganic diphosphatase [Entomospira culicis]NIZ69034.1 putative manganese-dependent inorganic diphosphatase [Entomospira culicis]WDI37622.1 putative manganese-dependent inorganic diphosphatase [Entomospira culicis]WDI39250.1 putative manganese-dependent inorganic diphosphatase [Entomospira culicis]
MSTAYKQIYVVGHRNPDADSLISAHAYANLKQLQGNSNVIAIRSGVANSQSEYIFQRFNAPLPLLLPDVIPKVMHFMQADPITIHYQRSLWDALQIITQEQIDTLPVVDDERRYLKLLCYESISLYIMQKTTASLRSLLISSLDLIQSTLKAQPITAFSPTKIQGYTLLVASSYSSTFKEEFDREDPQTLIVLIGDRIDLQRYIIERKVAIIIVTNNYIIHPDLQTLAQEHGVSILISAHDATTTSIMLLYSVPVGHAALETPAVDYDDTTAKAKNRIEHSTARAVAVVNQEAEVIGLLKEIDLNRRPNIALILVDHNELSQAISGVEHVDVLEVIDHHRLGGFKTNIPITFINQTVGSTSTIVANLYKTQHTPLDRTTASLLLCGILSDTLGLKSATTTQIDRDTARYLASLTQIDITTLSQELTEASNHIMHRSPSEVIGMDRKEYQEDDWKFFVSQIETSNPDFFLHNKAQYIDLLTSQMADEEALFCGLLITDTTSLSSYLIITAQENFISLIPYPNHSDHVYFLQDVLSRKKQLIPMLTEIISTL